MKLPVWGLYCPFSPQCLFPFIFFKIGKKCDLMRREPVDHKVPVVQLLFEHWGKAVSFFWNSLMAKWTAGIEIAREDQERRPQRERHSSSVSLHSSSGPTSVLSLWKSLYREQGIAALLCQRFLLSWQWAMEMMLQVFAEHPLCPTVAWATRKYSVE